MSFKLKSIRLYKLSFSLWLGAALFFPLMSPGAEQPIQPIPQSSFLDSTDTRRDYLSGKFVEFVSDVDRFFGDDKNYQESNESVIQLDIGRMAGRGAERKFVLSGRAKVHLPSLEKRLHLVLETNADKNVTAEPAQVQATSIDQVAAPESYAAGARYETKAEKIRHFSADAGIKFQGMNTSPFARLRERLAVPVGNWRMRAEETLFWFNTTGTGSNTQLDFERLISEPMLFRASSNATWLMKDQNFDVHQDFSVYHTLNERTALLYQASVIGVSKPQWEVTDYVLLLLYRYRLHREWVFLELSPQLHYPQVDNYRLSPMLGMRLEVLFDDPD